MNTPASEAKRTVDVSALGEVGLFVIVFGLAWTAAVLGVWKLALLPEPARPWFRALAWCGAVAIWMRLRGTRRPAQHLGLTPISLGAVVTSAIAFAVLLGWNAARVSFFSAPIGQLATFTADAYAWSFVGVFAEELVFRGAIQTRLTEAFAAPAAIALTSALFLFVHLPGWLMLAIPIDAGLVATVILLGVICGVLRYRAGSLWPAVAAHWANNLGAAI